MDGLRMPFFRFKQICSSIIFSILFCINVCRAEDEDHDQGKPAWIDNQSRTVIGGDILHLGVGDGRSAELARFRAESMAVRNVISECSLAHREIIIWDRYLEEMPDKILRAYARAGINFSACEEARKAKGEDRKRLSNMALVTNQDIYDQLEKAYTADQDGIFNRIKAWTLGITNQSNKKISELEERIERMERTPRSQAPITIVNKTVLVGAEATKEMRFRDCLAEYEEMMHEAQNRALASHPPGNLASPEAAPAYNTALRKLARCREIKSQ